MVLKKQPFRLYNEYERENNKQDVISLKLNLKEREDLERCKKVLNCDRDSTTIKTLASVGKEVLLDPKTRAILKIFLRKQAKGEEVDL